MSSKHLLEFFISIVFLINSSFATLPQISNHNYRNLVVKSHVGQIVPSFESSIAKLSHPVEPKHKAVITTQFNPLTTKYYKHIVDKSHADQITPSSQSYVAKLSLHDPNHEPEPEHEPGHEPEPEPEPYEPEPFFDPDPFIDPFHEPIPVVPPAKNYMLVFKKPDNSKTIV